MRRSLLTALAMAVLLVTAGCSIPGGSGTANVYVSDQPNAIDDFQKLEVSITEVGAYDEETGTWETKTVSKRVDLTRLQGANATHLTTMELPAGTYSKVYLKMDNVDGVLKNGTEASVELQSDQIQVATPFTVSSYRTKSYVYDITVTPPSDGAYVITSNPAGSGPNQNFTEV